MMSIAPLPFMAWAAFRLLHGEIRWDYVGFLVVPALLAWTTPRSKKLFVGIYPFGLVGLFYDAMRYVQNVGLSPERVHLCDLRAAEARFFGFGLTIDGAPATLHDWIQLHHVPVLDAFFAIPYGTFVFACLGFAVWLYRRDYPRMRRFAWGFFALNVAGFATYHLYPAAPPWYFHAHGCVVDMAAHASEGPALARVDAWLGVPYFHGMYGRASDVFGAVPSLHVAYPLLIILEGWAVLGRLGRAAAIAFFVSMCGGAVYLDHHWVIDVVLGLAYCVATFSVVRVASARLAAKAKAKAKGSANPALETLS